MPHVALCIKVEVDYTQDEYGARGMKARHIQNEQ
jgi:hypothetical protein